MGRFQQHLAEALSKTLEAERRFFNRKDKIEKELWHERVSQGTTTLPVEMKVLVDARLGKDPLAKSCVAENQWQIQRAIMFGQLELIEQQQTLITQQQTIITLLDAIARK